MNAKLFKVYHEGKDTFFCNSFHIDVISWCGRWVKGVFFEVQEKIRISTHARVLLFSSCRHSSTAVSSSCSAPLSRRLKMSSPSCSGRAEVSSWAGSPNPTATWLRRWAPLLTTQSRAPTRPSAHSTSSSTPKAHTGWRWCGEERCGQLHPRGSSTASQPSASCLCLNLKQQAKTHFFIHF